ncbi:MAG TPA: MaoC family dehydratase [Caulobacteraceae bacterium]|nr:MaoC family dehydratase [Caulobacteraceae bacterium]
MTKTNPGHYFEDFRLGQVLRHATPRTITEGDVALYLAFTGSRYAITSSDEVAHAAGLPRAPVDPLLVFHMVFGKSVPDISLNAVANLGYADGRFGVPVYPGDTVTATSEVIGLKENSNKKTGVVYVRTTGVNQRGEPVLTYVRWVMVRKRDEAAAVPDERVPGLPSAVEAAALSPPPGLDFGADYDFALGGSAHAFESYQVGEKIDHVDGMAIEEAEHQMATRLYQNTAKVHFNAFERAKDPSGRRLVYGGVVISTARALAFNGLENAGLILAVNGGRHVNPFFAGGTVFAWSEILDKADLGSCGALRLRLVATKDRPCTDFPDKDAEGKYPAEVILDFDYWATIPKRG